MCSEGRWYERSHRRTPLLAYVFWHWPRDGVEPAHYQSLLRAFHRQLAVYPSPGFQGSRVWRVDGASWLPGGSGYEDWYLLDQAGSLDSLEQAAVSDPRLESHDSIAALAVGGMAGLYQGEGSMDGSLALWLHKPAGMSYQTFLAEAQAFGGCIWMRKMVLGPTPEFCLVGDNPQLPQGWEGIEVSRQLVWRPDEGASA